MLVVIDVVSGYFDGLSSENSAVIILTCTQVLVVVSQFGLSARTRSAFDLGSLVMSQHC